MLSLYDVRIDPASLGGTMLLVEVRPIREYKERESTGVILGYRYDVCLPAHHLEKLSVKINGAQLMDSPEDAIPVEFADLEVSAYLKDRSVYFTATATGISPVGKKQP